jgi:hypothetical protein
VPEIRERENVICESFGERASKRGNKSRFLALAFNDKEAKLSLLIAVRKTFLSPTPEKFSLKRYAKMFQVLRLISLFMSFFFFEHPANGRFPFSLSISKSSSRIAVSG